MGYRIIKDLEEAKLLFPLNLLYRRVNARGHPYREWNPDVSFTNPEEFWADWNLPFSDTVLVAALVEDEGDSLSDDELREEAR